jgi:hypothetical protein
MRFPDEFADVCGEPVNGEGPGERPLSEFSVLSESVLGEAVRFQPKKEDIFPPGVCGFFASLADSDFADEAESIRSGGGLVPGFSAISSSCVV